MTRILNRIVMGLGKLDDLDFLQDISVLLSEASLCGLGTSAANPVLSTLKYFKHEYEAHINHKTCDALVCKALTAYYIDEKRCGKCGLCSKHCHVEAIEGGKDHPYRVLQERCIKCGACFNVCPKKFRAVSKISPVGAVPGWGEIKREEYQVRTSTK